MQQYNDFLPENRTEDQLDEHITETYPAFSLTLLKSYIKNYLKQQEDAQYQRPDSNEDSH
jgi:hypothetical protein